MYPLGLLSLCLSLRATGAAAAVKVKAYNCTSFMVAVPVDNITTIVPPFPPPLDPYQTVALANNFTAAIALSDSGGKPNLTSLTATFDISVEYCTPARLDSKTPKTLQILTHGVGFNRTYWDFYAPGKPDDPQYSYVNVATGAGHSTLAWNRLGHPPTTVADPYTEIQAPVEQAVLIALTTLIRAGNITQVPVPDKDIHVGHSWGSILSNGLAQAAPDLSDGLVLTAWSQLTLYQSIFVGSTGLHLANLNQPKRFPKNTWSNGFVTWPDKYANQYSFLDYPYFDPAVLDFAEATKYPFTIGEFLSQNSLTFDAPDFKGSVLYLAAERDLIFCGSNCTRFYGRSSKAVEAFNGSSSVETYIQPNVGHGINLHKNATGAYNVIIDWASRHGF